MASNLKDNPSEGLTADGRYVTNGNVTEDLTDQIFCGLDQSGDIIECAEVQPLEFLEKNWMEDWDFDERLFANYGKDWWLGILYKPARFGLLGATAQDNVTEAGDYIYSSFDSLKQFLEGAYLLVRSSFHLGMGVRENEAAIEQCLAAHPEQLNRFQELNSVIDHNMRAIAQTGAKRIAGGAFVGWSLRGVKVPNKYLTGRLAPARIPTRLTEFGAKMTLNFVLAGWGGMLRTYIAHTQPRIIRTQYATSWTPNVPPTPLELLGSALVGDSRVFDLNPDEIRDLSDIMRTCDNVPEDLQLELEAFAYFLDVFITFYEDRK